MKTALKLPDLPRLDEYDLLVDPNDWNESVAQELAQLSGVSELSQDHWLVLYALRHYYDLFGVAPAMNTVCRQHDHDKMWVHGLFGTCLNAWRIAGLPNPGEEAKSYLSDM